MIEIIPAILEKTRAGFLNKIKIAVKIAKWIQIDIMDGKFVPTKSYFDLKVFKKYPRNNFEAHLMVDYPTKYLKKLANFGVKRVIFHVECREPIANVIEMVKKQKMSAGLAFNPRTLVKKIKPFLNKIDVLLFLGVTPGRQGQKFQPSVLKKVKEVKKLKPRCKLALDGGVNDKNAKRLVRAGIDILCIGSYLLISADIKKTFAKLKSIN
ncbi:MAG: ribulose-phosphate 3-epimerase [Patescibacteria group bacterium]|nr:ribulose-phosphate 3-epimerase [Patescibacteria group bacterium]MDD5490931.1 ribulose-phosphate 3-epimerase [Patescibacteria group bacterium]